MLEVVRKLGEGGGQTSGVVFRRDGIGAVVRRDLASGFSVDPAQLAGDDYRAVAGAVGDEVDSLDNPHTRSNLDEVAFHDLGVCRGLAA